MEQGHRQLELELEVVLADEPVELELLELGLLESDDLADESDVPDPDESDDELDVLAPLDDFEPERLSVL